MRAAVLCLRTTGVVYVCGICVGVRQRRLQAQVGATSSANGLEMALLDPSVCCWSCRCRGLMGARRYQIRSVVIAVLRRCS